MQSANNFPVDYDDDYNPDFDKDDLEEDEDGTLDGWDVIEYTVPEWALSALFNGDTSGLEDEDEAAIAAFLKNEKLSEQQGHWSYGSENNEPYFSHTNDIHNLGDTVVDIQWVYRAE